MAYIDFFYKIDRDSSELIPIQYKTYPDNLNKTILSRLQVYTGILRSLTNDQYNAVTGKLNNLIEASKITYRHPEVVCPECGKTIEAQPIDSMLSVLFTRAQLAQIRNL